MNNWFLASAMFLSAATSTATQLVLNYTAHDSAGYGILAASVALVCYIKYMKVQNE